MQFIKIFWARRDPILRTRENEYKQKFYERVDYANETYAEKNGAGWKSARGRTYIMFGAPGRVDKQTFQDHPVLLNCGFTTKLHPLAFRQTKQCFLYIAISNMYYSAECSAGRYNR